jgi:hypothetical protein
MEIHYGPQGLHAELEAHLERLMAERGRTRHARRFHRRGHPDGASPGRH